MTKLQHDKLTVKEQDHLDFLLDECLTVSELLWSAENDGFKLAGVESHLKLGTYTRIGEMLTAKIKEIQSMIH